MPDKSIGERVVLQLYGQWRLVPGPEEARIEAKYSQERLALAIDAAIAADRQERDAAAEKRVAELVGLLHRARNGLMQTRDPSVDAIADDIAAAIKGGA